jgi:hypothetical protein
VHRVAEMLTRHGSPQWKANPITVRRFAGPATESVIKSLYREGQTHVVVRACCPSLTLTLAPGRPPRNSEPFLLPNPRSSVVLPPRHHRAVSVLFPPLKRRRLSAPQKTAWVPRR